MLRTIISRRTGAWTFFVALALVGGPAAGTLVAAGLPVLGGFECTAAPGLTIGLTTGLTIGLLVVALALLVAVFALALAFLTVMGLAVAVLRAALPGGFRPARALAEDAALAFTDELLLRTGRLADGIFWTLLKN